MLTKVIPKSLKILEEAKLRFRNIGVAFSGGSDSLVVLDLTRMVLDDFPVIFVDTYNQFKETYEYVEMVKKKWNLDLHVFRAEKNRVKELLLDRNYTPEAIFECCKYHKIDPLLKGVSTLKLDALVVGIRRAEHEERAKETYISPRKDHYRVHPILDWSRDDVLDYIAFYNLPINPLYNKGYTSLGCVWCTKPNPDPTKHERLGRDQRRERIQKVLREAGYT